MALLAWVVAEVHAFGASAEIQARLIYGTNEEDLPKEAALADLEPRFKPDFGYKHYRLLGEKKATLKEGKTDRLELGHEFAVRIRHRETKGDFHVLQIDVFHKSKKLLFLEVSVRQNSEPIFIKGPWTEKGLIIIALTAN